MVWTPLKNISQLGWLFLIYGKIKNGNQTTNQISATYITIFSWVSHHSCWIKIPILAGPPLCGACHLDKRQPPTFLPSVSLIRRRPGRGRWPEIWKHLSSVTCGPLDGGWSTTVYFGDGWLQDMNQGIRLGILWIKKILVGWWLVRGWKTTQFFLLGMMSQSKVPGNRTNQD